MLKYIDKEKVFTHEEVMVSKTNDSDFSEKVNAILMSEKLLLERDIRKGTYITLDERCLKLEVYQDSKIEKTVCIYGASAESHPIVYSFYRHAKDIRNDSR
ncbi:hypothetical protein [Saccharicrinis aurantiacus]|uniref:hypothetical protein n=1 Tax=Saccharicrinis aurantiacus TaxID=1849719 RepID=UPI000837FAC5|nr:hypothetical protein [Saccharicrinis aurantiacus]